MRLLLQHVCISYIQICKFILSQFVFTMELSTVLIVLLVVALIIILTLSVGLHQKSINAFCLSRRRLEGKTVIVSGGTAGIGLEIAKDLAHRGARVIIACPYENEGVEARHQIVKETENSDVIFKLLDLSSLESTRHFAEDILNTETRLDILINNAGVGVPTDRRTKDGVHFIIQVNYYGTFLLTILLLPLLKRTGKINEPSRILVTVSSMHWFGGHVDNQEANESFFPLLFKIRLYSSSKLYLLYFSNELAKRLKGWNVVVNNVDPGIVGTKIFYSVNKPIGFVLSLLSLMLFKTPWEGAQTTLHVALDRTGGELNDAYFKNCKPDNWSRSSHSGDIIKEVWNESLKLVKLTDKELDKCFKRI